MKGITPFLWFDHQAEEAANFYVSIFPHSKVKTVTRYGDAGPGPKGSVMTVAFELDGKDFVALNGGPRFQLSPATSFVANCENQKEVDELWTKLSEGGQPNQCGWLTDKYGVTWQIVPTILPQLLQDKDPERSQRVMQAMFQMTKIEIEPLKKAYEESAAHAR